MKHTYVNTVETKYMYGEMSELTELELRDIEELGIEEIWYWYACGSYEGTGQILMRKGDLYSIHDAGHCSCYGPTERISFVGEALDKLAKSMSKEYFDEAKRLFELAGYKPETV